MNKRDANRLELLDRIADRVPELDLEQEQIEWIRLDDAMVACRDRDAFVHIWTNYERHVVRRRGLVRRRPVYEIDMRNEFHRQFPDVDTTKLKPAGAAPSPPTR